MNKAKQSGFTIVELLVVIVIIGILATIGFVTFANAQNRAKKSEVESTMAQTKAKLGEYYASFNTYPDSMATLVAYMDATNNGATADKLDGTTIPSGTITYAADDDAGSGSCTITDADSNGEPEAGTCTTFSLVGVSTYWGGTSPTDDLTVTP